MGGWEDRLGAWGLFLRVKKKLPNHRPETVQPLGENMETTIIEEVESNGML